jgi:hypothetical protein
LIGSVRAEVTDAIRLYALPAIGDQLAREPDEG